MVSSLFRFMLIFEINRFWVFEVSEKTISGRVGWANDGTPDYDEDEEIQDIEWDIQFFDNLQDALELSEYLIDKKLMHNDKVTIDSNELFIRVGWQKARYEAAIETLMSVKVDMLDEGRRTDQFFVHW